MSAYFDDHLLSEIEARIDIVDLVSEDIVLNRKGNRHWGLCPFHQEKTPSFSVNQEKQMFYCFGCHEGGNIYSYLMKRHGYSFPESVEQLAQRAGIRLEQKASNPRDQRRQQNYDLNRVAAEFFSRSLCSDKGQTARNYLARRGISQESIDKFQLGWAPDGWSSLQDYLLKKGYSKDLLKQSGLLRANEEQTRYYDSFRDRIMFPIIQSHGNISGFGGRSMGDQIPKYLNTPETELFSKRRNLYAVAQARGALREHNEAVLVEGYMDCIKLHQYGIGNVVASLGTSFTREQAELLGRYVDSVLLMYDGDEAGQRETMRAIEVLREKNFKVQVVSLPDNQDPDEFIERVGKKGFIEYIQKNKISCVEFKLKQYLKEYPGRLGLQDQLQIIQRLRVDVLNCDSVLEQEGYIRLMARRLSMEEFLLRQELKRDINIRIRNKTGENRDTKVFVNYGIQEKILLAILQNEDYFERINASIGLKFFANKEYQKILEIYTDLKNILSFNEIIFQRRLSEAGLEGKYAAILLQGEGREADDLFVEEFISRVERQRNDRKWQSILQTLQESEDSAEFFDILSFIVSIEKSLTTAREGG